MKKMKRFFALFLAMAMVLGMSMTVFAAESVGIKLGNMSSAEKIEYAKVIVADPSADSGWNFASDAVAQAYASAFELTGSATVAQKGRGSVAQTALWMLIKYQAEYTKTTVTNLPSGITAASADQIGKALSNAAGVASFTTLYDKATATEGATVPTSFNVSEAGVYAVRAEETGFTYQVMSGYVGFGPVNPETGSYPTLTGTTVVAKKTETTTNKTTTDQDHVVAIGDLVTYTINVNVPFINPNDTANRSFTITDSITGADYYLTGEDAVATVQMAGKDVVVTEGEGEDAVVKSGADLFDVDGTTFEIDLTSLINDANSNAGNGITVTYTARVTAVTVENTAQGHTGRSDYSSDTVNVFTGEIALSKYGEFLPGSTTERVALAGAVFNVYAADDIGADGQIKEGASPLKFDYKDESSEIVEGEDGTTGAVVDVAPHYLYNPDNTSTTASANVTTDVNGMLIVRGLNTGSYHFVEVEAPEGYSINADGANATLAVTGEAASIISAETSIVDTTLNALPATGGIGTTIFTVGGCAIMIVAAGLFFVSRRKASR